MPRAKRTPEKITLSEKSLPDGHIQITVSGPPEHVRAALTNMSFLQPVSPLLCLQIALIQTGSPVAQPASELGGLNLLSPESRTGYAERCALSLKAETGSGIDPGQLPQDASTTVYVVSQAMYDLAS